MSRSRVRRPWCFLSLLALLSLACGCDMPGGSRPAASGGSGAEAEKTRQMEAKEAEYQRHAEEVRTMEGTEQEKIDAMSSLDQERREKSDASVDFGEPAEVPLYFGTTTSCLISPRLKAARKRL